MKGTDNENRGSFSTNRDMIEGLHGYLIEAGRQREDFGIEARINIADQPQAEWGNQMNQWRELGTTHICVNTMGAKLSSLQEHIKVIRQFKDVVGGI